MIDDKYANFFSYQIVNDRLLGVAYSLGKLLDTGNLLVENNDGGYVLYEKYCSWYREYKNAQFDEGCLSREISTRTLSALKQNRMLSIADALEYIWKQPLTDLKGIGQNGAYSIMRWIAHREQKEFMNE
jgi:hypothetical protein